MPILTNEERIGTTVLDRYAIKRLIGEGGMGAVFEGTHTVTRRRVAVKSLHPEYAMKSDVVQRFFQEAHAATAINHPSIVQVLDMGVDSSGAAFLVLEFLEGEDLNDALQREGRLSVQRTVEVLLPVMSGLSAAHAKGIVHRDIKPANIFLARQDDGTVVSKLLDFGISKMTAGDALARTSTGAVLGTPYYMAPEQARGEKSVDHLVDVWAMGVVLYQCLSGVLPFAADNYNQMILKLITEEPPALQSLVSGLPPSVVAAVHKALSKDRAGRWPTMAALAGALSEFARPDTIGRVSDATNSSLALGHTQPAMAGSVLPLPALGAAPTGPVTIPRTSVVGPETAVSTSPSTAMSWAEQAARTPVAAEPARRPRSALGGRVLGGVAALVLVGAATAAVLGGSKTPTNSSREFTPVVSSPLQTTPSPGPMVGAVGATNALPTLIEPADAGAVANSAAAAAPPRRAGRTRRGTSTPTGAGATSAGAATGAATTNTAPHSSAGQAGAGLMMGWGGH
jgi:serine/threonine-protein kinase